MVNELRGSSIVNVCASRGLVRRINGQSNLSVRGCYMYRYYELTVNSY